MHGTWFVLRYAWAAILISYLVFYVAASGRLRGQAKRRNTKIFVAVVGLYVSRELIWYVLGAGTIYRFGVMVVGLAAGSAALFLAHSLVTQGADVVAVKADGKLET